MGTTAPERRVQSPCIIIEGRKREALEQAKQLLLDHYHCSLEMYHQVHLVDH
jgi:hypothetical protein